MLRPEFAGGIKVRLKAMALRSNLHEVLFFFSSSIERRGRKPLSGACDSWESILF